MTDDESFFRQLNSHLSIRPPLPLHQPKDWEFGRHPCRHVCQRDLEIQYWFLTFTRLYEFAIPDRSKNNLFSVSFYRKSPGISLRSVDKALLKYFIRILRNAIIDLLIWKLKSLQMHCDCKWKVLYANYGRFREKGVRQILCELKCHL